jgi:hypothetical protein
MSHIDLRSTITALLLQAGPIQPRPHRWIAAVQAVVVAWFRDPVHGRYPRSLFAFVEGVLRWTQRVFAYAFLLVTDVHPSFTRGCPMLTRLAHLTIG